MSNDYPFEDHQEEFTITNTTGHVERYDDLETFLRDHFLNKSVLHFPIVNWQVTPAEYETDYDEDEGEVRDLVQSKTLYICWVDGPRGKLMFGEVDLNDDDTEEEENLAAFLAARWDAIHMVWRPVSTDS